MPLAAKHFDVIGGLDVHIVQPPGQLVGPLVETTFAVFSARDYALVRATAAEWLVLTMSCGTFKMRGPA